MGGEVFYNSNAKLEEQTEIVQNYFEKVCKCDPWGLSLHGFFDRVCYSIKNNGAERTSMIYELDLDILKDIHGI